MRAFLVAFAFSSAAIAELVPVPEHGVRLERGFRITQFSDEKLANDIWCLTLNPRGEVVVSGPGYIATLLDTDADGRADKAIEFTKLKGGAMGLAFNQTGKQFLVMADGWLSEYRDDDLDRIADGPPRKILPFASGEHGGHAIRMGPDGWWWVIGGNNAGITAATHNNPEAYDPFAERNLADPWDHKNAIPDVTAGAIVRIAPDFKTWGVVADGFRNPYDFDFNERGDIFTYDSDCERDYFLPWYSGCRVYHVQRGRHHGWLLPGHERSFRVPDYMPQVVPALADLGRGSPTGVICLKSPWWPAAFRGGLLVCDWTFGRIYHVALEPKRDGAGHARRVAPANGKLHQSIERELLEIHQFVPASYHAQTAIVLEPIGTHGFAPTGVVQAVDGGLFVSIGGRKTRGSVYRIQPEAGAAAVPSVPMLVAPQRELNPILKRLAMIQARLGGWNLHKPSADAFAPYEPALPGELPLLDQKAASELAQDALLSLEDNVRTEASRLLAMIEDGSAISASRILGEITAKSAPTQDFHYLACFARMRAERTREHTTKVAHAVLDLDRKLAGGDRRPKQMWVVRLNEVVARLIERDPALAEALIAGFNAPGHLPLVEALPAAKRDAAARRFLEMTKAATALQWSPELVKVLGSLPEAYPLLRTRWQNRALRRALRDALKFDPAPETVALLSEKELAPAIESVAEFAESLKTVAWDRGDAVRGEKVFRERACATCHAGVSPIGPELTGPVTRLSAVDLMTDIQFPNRNIADAFRAMWFTLKDGTTRNGYVAFLSADGVIIQTGPGVTERLAESDIVSREESKVSLMPPALLSGLKAVELADLYAYLRSLRK